MEAYEKDLDKRLDNCGGWVNHKTELPTENQLKKIVAFCDQALTVSAEEDYAALVELLVASYPNTRLSKPAVYFHAIFSILIKLPFDLAAKLVDEITQKEKFLPTRAEINEKAKTLFARTRLLKSTALLMIRELKKRQGL